MKRDQNGEKVKHETIEDRWQRWEIGEKGGKS